MGDVRAGTRAVLMSSLFGFPALIALVSVHYAGLLASVIAGRFRARRPACKLTEREAYLLNHSKWEKAFAWSSFAITAAIVVAAFRGSETVAGTVFILAFAALHAFLTLKLVKRSRNEVEVSDDGMSQQRGEARCHVRWSEIQSIRENPYGTSVVFRSASAEVRVDKLMDGLHTLFQFMQRKLPPQMFYRGLMAWGSAAAAALSGIRVTGDDESSGDI